MGVATSSASITLVTRSNAPSSQNFYCQWAAKLRNKLGSFLYAARRLFVEEGRVTLLSERARRSHCSVSGGNWRPTKTAAGGRVPPDHRPALTDPARIPAKTS